MSEPATDTVYKALPPEPWGRMMKRAREDVAKMTLLQAVAKIGAYYLTSDATLSRIEGLTDLPTDRKRRALAYAAVTVYKIDPEIFGLHPDDAPPGMREGAVNGKSSSACTPSGANVITFPMVGRSDHLPVAA